MATEFVQKCRKIVCVGRNYAEHAKELGNQVPTEPVLFLKPPSSMTTAGPVVLPRGCGEAHHEVEMAVIIGKGGAHIDISGAMEHVAGYAVGLDMTDRTAQGKAKAKGLPWTVAKGYDTFCPMGPMVEAHEVADPHALRLRCTVDGEVRQDGVTSDMIFNVPFLIHHISSIMRLEASDVILTGTPSGVGPVTSGQTMVGELLQGDAALSAVHVQVA